MGSSGLLFSMAFASILLVGMSLTAAPSSADFVVTSTAPGNNVSSANLVITNDMSGNAALLNVTNFVPGDTAKRVVTISNTGNIGFTYTAAASTTTDPTTALWTDATNGLQIAVYRCNDCTTIGNRVYNGALKDLAVPQSGTIAASATEALTLVVSLPSTAGNSFRNLTQNVTITFTATQLAGSAK